jgi:hypothetical protein
METWYRKQEFFNEIQLQKIKRWTETEVIDIHSFPQVGIQSIAPALS